MKSQTFKIYILTSLICFCSSFVVASATSTGSSTGSVSIRQSVDPITPVIYDVPTTVSCQSQLTVQGRAEDEVYIYVNNYYKVTSDSNSGRFQLTLYLVDGVNTFEVKSLRGTDYSAIGTYIINASSSNCSSYQSESVVSSNGGNPVVKDVVEHFDTIDMDEYIIDQLPTLDVELTPIQEVEHVNSEPEVVTAVFKEIVEDGITHTYDDLDNDGVSDLVEEFLKLDINSADSDLDGVADIDEILLETEIETQDFTLKSNISDGKVFTCDNFLLHGSIEKKDLSSVESVQFCLNGEGEVCSDVTLNDENAFVYQVKNRLAQGTYTASFKVLDEVISEFEVGCLDSSLLSFINTTKIDVQNVYKKAGNRVVRKDFLYGIQDRPIVQGFGAQHDLVYGFWSQSETLKYKSIVLADLNGYFKFRPYKELDTTFGFGKANLFVYGLDDGVILTSDSVTFYVFDLLFILFELIVIGGVVHYVRRHFRKKKRKSFK